MIFRILSICVLGFLVQSCSFRNSYEPKAVSFRARAAVVPEGDFAKAEKYDKACLTYRGGDGVQRTGWQDIDRSAVSLSVNFKIPNLLGGYPYTFTVFAVDTDDSRMNDSVLKSPCPDELPNREGWARMGVLKREIPQKVDGTLDLEIPFDFYRPVTSVPGPPTELGVGVQSTKVELTWIAPENDGGADITGYVVEFKKESESAWTDINYQSPPATVIDLAAEKTYLFRVAATNEKGQGDPVTVTAVTLTAPSSGGDVVSACEGNCYLGAQNLPIDTERQGPDNKTLTLQYANGTSGFKIWKEKNGVRILNATGLVVNGWQKELTREGTAFSATDFTTASDIADRVCPPHVFLSHSDMTTVGRCLYYDAGNVMQALNQETSGTLGEDYLLDWDQPGSGPSGNGAASYYEGNIKTCADKGMRLPTMYETALQQPPGGLLISLPDGDTGVDPQWAGSNGVPGKFRNYFFWTASAFKLSGQQNIYWLWNSNSNSFPHSVYSDPHDVRCVLPSHDN